MTSIDDTGHDSRRCFGTGLPPMSDRCLVAFETTLGDRPAAALGALLPLLGCGEEAASLAFDGLADRRGSADPITHALRTIAAEERVHDDLITLITRMRMALPNCATGDALLRASRRFHVTLARGGAAAHLARIAALDSAVCTLLSRLLRPNGSIARDPVIAGVLARIRSDEARHVRVSRGLALQAGATVATRDLAAAARGALADILLLAGDAFETLGVDPSVLHREVRRLPDGLLIA